MASKWGMTPRQSIEAACARQDRKAVVAGCIAILLEGDADDDLLWTIAGPASRTVLAGGAGGHNGYWPRVWATRGLLYVWEDAAVPAVVSATHDDAWRVREMAAKVVAKHLVTEAFDDIVDLRDDPVGRVRTAAERAVVELTRAGA